MNDNATLAGGLMAADVRFYENVQLRHALATLRRWGVRIEDPSQLTFGNRLRVLITHA